MTYREFFFAVARMRKAQKEYFKGRDPLKLRAARAMEGDIDRYIAQVIDQLRARGEDI